MKKLVIAANGHPRTNNDLIHLQDAIVEVANALGMMCSNDGVTELTLVAGFKFISTGSQSANRSPAFFHYNNELFYCGAIVDIQDVTHLRIQSVYAANNPYLGKNIHNIRTLIPVLAGTNIAGDIPLTYSNFANNIVNKATIALENWRYVGASGQIAWQNNFSSGTVPTTAYNLRYRKIFGMVYITGSIDFNPFSSINNGGPLTICTLPVGYRPDIDYYYSMRVQAQAGGFTANFAVYTSGLVRCNVVFDAGVSNGDLSQQWGGDMIYFTFANA